METMQGLNLKSYINENFNEKLRTKLQLSVRLKPFLKPIQHLSVTLRQNY